MPVKSRHGRQRHSKSRSGITTNTTRTLELDNYYCPDKSLELDTIQVTNNSFFIAGDFNSKSQS
jgi:hypothetical protein